MYILQRYNFVYKIANFDSLLFFCENGFIFFRKFVDNFNFFVKFFRMNNNLYFFKFLLNFIIYKLYFSGISLMDMVCVDFSADKIMNNNGFFGIFYNLFNYERCFYVIFSIFELLNSIPTTCYLYLASPWLERECWDMFGIFFVGNNSLRRILTDYGFVGFPLKKDFPVVGFFEVFFDDEINSVVYDNVSLSQEIRLWRRLI